MLFREMRSLAGKEAPGPRTSITIVHALYALFILDKTAVGRQRLAANLFIGEGSARTFIRKLERRGFARADRSGCRLTTKGKALYSEAKKVFEPFMPGPGSVPGPVSFGVLVRGGGRVAKGILERDEAIKAGAEGAMTLIYRDGELHMPGLSNVTREHPELSAGLLQVVTPSEGDAVIVSWGRSPRDAVYGALAAAWSVYNRLSGAS